MFQFCMHMNRFAILIFCLVSSWALAIPGPRTALVTVQKEGKTDTLRLLHLDVEVQFVGDQAVTTYEMDFVNPHEEILSGDFWLPLWHGQDVRALSATQGGALKAAGTWRRPAPVIFFAPNQLTDSMQMLYGRNRYYHSPLFQLPADGEVTVRVTVVEKLARHQGRYRYVLPMRYSRMIDECDISLKGLPVKPHIAFGRYTRWEWTEEEGAWTGTFEQDPFTGGTPLQVEWPAPDSFLQTGLGKVDRKYYFYLNQHISTPERPFTPRRIALLWDVSYSERYKNVEEELALLDAYFGKIGQCTLQVVGFHHRIVHRQDFVVHKGDWKAARQLIRGFVYEGGTGLGLPELGEIRADVLLLSSDGRNSVGAEAWPNLTGPLYCLNSRWGEDQEPLRRVAAATGGRLTDLTLSTPDEALEHLLSPLHRLEKIEYDPAEVTSVYPSGAALLEGRQCVVSGILLKNAATLRLHLLLADGSRQVQTVQLSRQASPSGYLMEQFWAAMRRDELLATAEENAETLTAHCLRYGLCSPLSVVRFGVGEQETAAAPAQAAVSSPALPGFLQQADTAVIDVMSYTRPLLDWHARTFTPDYTANERPGADGKALYDVMLGQDTDPAPAVESPKTVQAPPLLPVPIWAEIMLLPAEGIAVYDPARPYLDTLSKAKPQDRHAVFLGLREKYGRSPAFFGECATFFREKGEPALAISALFSIVELDPSATFARYAARHMRWQGYATEAVAVLEPLRRGQTANPLFLRDLALAMAETGRADEALRLLEQALVQAGAAVHAGGLREILAADYACLSATSKSATLAYPKLTDLAESDLRVTVESFSGEDVGELLVIDPHREVASPGRSNTSSGGRLAGTLSAQGLSQFWVKRMTEGDYELKINFLGKNVAGAAFPSEVMVTIWKGGGNQRLKLITMEGGTAVWHGKDLAPERFYVKLPDKAAMINAGTIHAEKQKAARIRDEGRYIALETEASLQDYVFSGDGRYIATAEEKGVTLWDLQSAKALRRIADEHPAITDRQIVFSEDGKWMVVLADSLVTAAQSSQQAIYISLLEIFEVSSGKKVKVYPCPRHVQQMAILGDRVFFDDDQALNEYDLQTGQASLSIYHVGNHMDDFAVSQSLIAIAHDGFITLKDAQTLGEVRTFKAKGAAKLSLSSRGDLLLYQTSGTEGEKAVLIRTQSGEQILTFNHYPETGIRRMGQMALSPDGRFIASQPFASNEIFVKSVPEGVNVLTYFHRDPVGVIHFSPNGLYLSSSDKGSAIRVRKVATLPYNVIPTETGDPHIVTDPSSHQLYIGAGPALYSLHANHDPFIAFDGRAELVKTQHAEEITQLQLYRPHAGYLFFTDQKGRQTTIGFHAIKSHDHHLEMNLRDWLRHKQFDQLRTIAVSPDGHWLLFNEGAQLKALNLQKLRHHRPAPGLRSSAESYDKDFTKLIGSHAQAASDTGAVRGISSIVFSPDGQWFATRGEDRQIKIWETATMNLLASRAVPGTDAEAMVFGPKGKELIYADAANHLQIWQWQANKIRAVLMGHRATVRHLALSPSAKQIVSVSDDHTLRVWHLGKATETHLFYDYQPATAVFFREDILLSTGKLRDVKCWKIQQGGKK